MTTLQKTLVTATVAVLAGVGIYETRLATQLRSRVDALEQQRAPLASQLDQLQHERDEAARQLAVVREANARLKRDTEELLKLRAEVGGLQSQLATAKADVEKLRNESVHGSFRPRSEWADKGNGDPFSTVETMLWAVSQQQNARLLDVVALGKTAESDLFPAEHPPVQSIGAVNLIYSQQNQEGTKSVVTAFAREDFIAPPGGSPYSVNKLIGWKLTNSVEGWRVSRQLFFDLAGE